MGKREWQHGCGRVAACTNVTLCRAKFATAVKVLSQPGKSHLLVAGVRLGEFMATASKQGARMYIRVRANAFVLVHMVSEGGGVCKACVLAARPVALVGLDSLVCALVGAHVGAVCKALLAPRVAAHVGLLPGVDADVGYQVRACLELLGLWVACKAA